MFTISLKQDSTAPIDQVYEVRDASGKVIGTLTRTSQGYIASDLDIDANPALTLTSLGEVSIIDADPNDYLDVSEPFGTTRVKVSGNPEKDYIVSVSKGDIA